MASRSSAYFHLLSSYFLVPAAALDAWTCGPLIQETEEGCKRWATKTHSWELWGTVSRWSFPPTPHHSLLRGSLLGSLKDCAMHPVGFFIGFPSIHDIKVTNLLGKKNLRVVLIVRISQLFIYWPTWLPASNLHWPLYIVWVSDWAGFGLVSVIRLLNFNLVFPRSL